MVSVIIPNYNHSKYLKQRIDSVLDQTYQDYELIILDDCSPDNSREIIEAYRDHPKVSQIIYNEENSGSTFKQWKRGIDLAKGDYIWIAESDDWAENTFLEKCINSIEVNNSSVSFTLSALIDNNNNKIGQKPPVLEEDVIDGVTFCSQHLLYGNSIYNASMCVFKKDMIPNNTWDRLKSFRYCGDWFFWYKILSQAKIRVSEVKEPLNNFRIHQGNVSNKSEKNGLTILEGFEISKLIYNSFRVNDLSIGTFSKKWYEKWRSCRIVYSFSKKADLKVFLFFVLKQPRVLYWMGEGCLNKILH